MRGTEKKQATMLTLLSPDRVVPEKDPLRRVKALADAALRELSPVFDEMYSAVGRPSIPPERLLKASLLIAFYSVRSETLFCEQLNYNLLYRWFLDMNMDEGGFVQETFSKNRERLMKHQVASLFFGKVVEQAQAAGLMSDEHFTVDGTLIDAWASLKSFRPKAEEPEGRPPPDDKGNPTVNFHGEKRSNQTHESKTDPDSRLARKGAGKEAKLSYAQHALMENRNGLLVELLVTQASGTAEREAALEMMHDYLPSDQRITLAGDKGFDTRGFIEGCRELNVTPHVAQNLARSGGSAIDGRTTRHPGYAISQRIRKRVEEIFGWTKTVANFRKTRFKGLERTQMASYLVGAAYNLLRMAKLLLTPAAA
ncbi:MAG: IS5 family transposase [Deltaproteobacteria bacterium]|nr:MAG: IS5 family transposase [Deltaproteobacteria bacterium]